MNEKREGDRIVDHRFDPDDERQEFELGRWLWQQSHPDNAHERGNAQLKGYWRRGYYRKHQSRWHALRVSMIEAITATDIGLDFDAMLLREILELLPLTKKKYVLKVLLKPDGRKIRGAARIVREELPEFVKKVGREIMV